jgi:hypothetical protein
MIMRSTIITVFLCLITSVTVFSQEVNYVTVKQDGTGDYSSIQAALDDPMRAFNEIVVFQGLYKENIVISQDIILRSYDGPYLTGIDGSARVQDRTSVITVSQQIKDVKIVGFYITGGDTGIFINTSSHVQISNCVIHKNNGNGIWAYWHNEQEQTVCYIYNNVIIENNGNGIYIDDLYKIDLGGESDYIDFFPIHVKNNIIMSNKKRGINHDNQNYSPRVYNPSNLVIDFNNLIGNIDGNYGSFIGTGQQVVPGNNIISENPQFIGTNTGIGLDVRLKDTSPCRDAGEDGVNFNDPDGTRNDIGAFGGPWASTFYQIENNGPVVRDVILYPASVPQGDTFVIKAVGSVR